MYQRVAVGCGVYGGRPMRVAGEVDVVLRIARDPGDADPRGISFSPQVGLGAGKFSVGYVRQFYYFVPKQAPFMSYSPRVFLMRTWARPRGAEPRATFAGGELKLTFFLLSFNVGAFTSVRKPRDNLLSIGFGIEQAGRWFREWTPR